jgi:Pro-kumamolisin, activation domain
MFEKLRTPCLLVVVFCLFAVPWAQPQSTDAGRYSRPRVTQMIDESKRVTLAGNTHPAARPESDPGKVKNNLAMNHLLLQLRRPPEQEKAIEKFIDQLHNPASPDFHKWLSAAEYGEKFGLSQDDLDSVTQWLKLQGF